MTLPLLCEARLPLLAAVMAGFGAVISEVGASPKGFPVFLTRGVGVGIVLKEPRARTGSMGESRIRSAARLVGCLALLGILAAPGGGLAAAGERFEILVAAAADLVFAFREIAAAFLSRDRLEAAATPATEEGARSRASRRSGGPCPEPARWAGHGGPLFSLDEGEAGRVSYGC